MNKNTSIILSVAAAILVLGGITYAIINKTSVTPAPVTPTPPVVTNPTPVASPSASAPAAPTVITSPTIAPWSSTAVVTGTVNPNGAMTSYWFEYGLQPNSTSRTNTQIIGSGYSAIPTPAYITGLNASTKYFFRLVAENSLGKVIGTQYAFQTTLASPPQGTVPTTQSIAASGITRATANLNGRINTNGTQTTYWFEYGLDTSFGSVTAFQPIGSGTLDQNVSVSISNLKPQTKYYFRLNAQNQFGTINGSILNFTTQGPAEIIAPTVDTKPATGIQPKTATLNGSINPNGAATEYWFEYSTDSLIGSIIGTVTATKMINSNSALVNVNTQITGLSSSTRYYFRLVGRNSQGTVRGDVENFTTKK